jgi:hypothetical protein
MTVEFPTSALSLAVFHSATFEIASQELFRIRDIKTKLRDRQADLIRLTIEDLITPGGLTCSLLPASSNAWPEMGATGDTTILSFW